MVIGLLLCLGICLCFYAVDGPETTGTGKPPQQDEDAKKPEGVSQNDSDAWDRIMAQRDEARTQTEADKKEIAEIKARIESGDSDVGKKWAEKAGLPPEHIEFLNNHGYKAYAQALIAASVPPETKAPPETKPDTSEADADDEPDQIAELKKQLAALTQTVSDQQLLGAQETQKRNVRVALNDFEIFKDPEGNLMPFVEQAFTGWLSQQPHTVQADIPSAAKAFHTQDATLRGYEQKKVDKAADLEKLTARRTATGDGTTVDVEPITREVKRDRTKRRAAALELGKTLEGIQIP